MNRDISTTPAAGRMASPPWVIGYVAIVLVVDTLIAHRVTIPFHWSVLHFQPYGFDVFKAVAWLIIPLCLTFRMAHWDWFGVKRWRRSDVAVLAGMAAIGALAVLLIKFVPGLRGFYPSYAGMPAQAKIDFAVFYAIWWLSWLPGWEYMHRFYLLGTVNARWPVWGWILVPVFEALYHLQKHPLEAAGMFAMGVVLTWWARKRENVLLPFLAHFLVEAELLAFQLLL